MSIDQNQFQDLVGRVRTNDDDAAFELFDRCKYRIYAAVRRRLDRRMRSKFDSHDFVQAVWASFFCNVPDLDRFKTEDELLCFLIRMAGNKVADEYRRRIKTEKYAVYREKHLSGFGDSIGFQPPSHDPTPSETMIARESWEQILNQLPPRYRNVLELRRSGSTMQEIADQLNLSERTVRRLLKNLTVTEI